MVCQTAPFKAGAILRPGGKCRGVALKARLAGVGGCLDSSCEGSAPAEKRAQFKIEISKLINSESNSKFENFENR